MPKKLTITMPDDAYASLQSAAKADHRTPEELAAQVVLEQLSGLARQRQQGSDATKESARDEVLSVMRQQGHLVERVESAAGHPPFSVESLPLNGSTERARLEVEVATELSDALTRSGLSVLDLIERR